MSMNINGKPHDLPAKSSISAVLDLLGIGEKPVVEEMDRLAIFPRDYPSMVLPDQAVLEVVTLAACG
jgi:sulfur carrier protein ThiS